MHLFVKKPIPIPATQWFKYGDHPAVETIPPGLSSHSVPPDADVSVCGYIKTLEGGLIVTPGSWVVGPGAAGEFWPVQNEIFLATYEAVQEKPEDDPKEKKDVKEPKKK